MSVTLWVRALVRGLLLVYNGNGRLELFAEVMPLAEPFH